MLTVKLLNIKVEKQEQFLVIMLFGHILKKSGDWRDKEILFGDLGDEELYKIPFPKDVPREISLLASEVTSLLKRSYGNLGDRYATLAYIHYQFIRIHPFNDGNGRIARAITDQLSIYFGLPPAMAGYPRHDDKRREGYHHAIKSCIVDPTCSELADWISSYIKKQLENLA